MNEGFPSTEWGPGLWQFMHMIALNIRPNEKATRAYMHFFGSLQHVLPCGVCRLEYCKLVNSNTGSLPLKPSLFRNRAKAFAWTVDLHRAVTARTNKKKIDLDRRIDWQARYESLRHRSPAVQNLMPTKRTVILYSPRSMRDCARVQVTLSRFYQGHITLRIVGGSSGLFLVDRTRQFTRLEDVMHVLHKKYKK
jgi:hypothetical protein